MIIDTHAHAVPKAFVELIRSGQLSADVGLADGPGCEVLLVGGERRGPIVPDLIDMPGRIAWMDAQGMDVQVLASWVGAIVSDLDPTAGTAWAQGFNDSLLEEVERESGRLLAFAQVPLQAPAEAALELTRVLTNPFCVGVEIKTTVLGTDLDSVALEPFWAAAAAYRCPVMVHPDQALGTRLSGRHHIRNTVGNPTESAIAAMSLICGGVMERHPDLVVLLVHGGGYAPFQIGRADHAHRTVPALVGDLRLPPSSYLSRMYCDTVTHAQNTLRFSLDTFGTGHVLLGSDFPFDMGAPHPVQDVTQLGLATSDEAGVLGGTFEELVGAIVRP